MYPKKYALGARPPAANESPPDAFGQLIDEKSAQEFHSELKQKIKHGLYTMALSRESAKAGKASLNPTSVDTKNPSAMPPLWRNVQRGGPPSLRDQRAKRFSSFQGLD